MYRMTSTSANGFFGRVREFLPERETFNAYVERMELSFTTITSWSLPEKEVHKLIK